MHGWKLGWRKGDVCLLLKACSKGSFFVGVEVSGNGDGDVVVKF